MPTAAKARKIKPSKVKAAPAVAAEPEIIAYKGGIVSATSRAKGEGPSAQAGISADSSREATQAIAAALRARLHYDPVTGIFIRRATGRELRARQGAGYISIRFNGRSHLAHRLAWLYVHGQWPNDQLDHINCDRTDNRIANLRACTNQQNAQNMSPHRDGGGSRGVSWMPKRGKWQAGIGINGRRISLGYHETKEAALAAYAEAKASLHAFGDAND